MHIDEIRDLLKQIRLRPGLYLGGRSLPALAAFLDGYVTGRRRGDPTFVEAPLGSFQDWVAARFGIRTSHGWRKIIEFYAMEEGEAFELFWDLFAQFEDEHSATQEVQAKERGQQAEEMGQEPTQPSGPTSTGPTSGSRPTA